VADAYVAPVVVDYLGRLTSALGASVRVMLSSGGAVAAAEARRRPVRTLLSGPAAGVVGARTACARAGLPRAITLDMGGTSTDVALIDLDRDVELSSDGEVAGVPIRVPSLAIHTVGAGGGSIARVDAGGALKVGPASAGAAPGPVCYGRGGSEPTVTDAALVEGRLDPDRFLGGEMRLDRAAAERAIGALAARLGLAPGEAARGVSRVATAVMARAIKAITVEKGHDPRDFALVAFGGAGGMFACDVADALGIERVLVPAAPGLLCAYGALAAEVARDLTATRIGRGAEAVSVAAIAAELAPLEAEARAALAAEGFADSELRIARRVDLRYRGQSYEIPIGFPGDGDLAAAFHREHERRYGFAAPAREIERVAVRLHAHAAGPPPPPLSVVRGTGEVVGPAILVEYSATTYVAAGWRANAGADGALILTRCKV
jgi:N-methylhydantoinase A